jgi:hypothetical protein
MGAGGVFDGAIADLKALSPDAVEVRVALPVLVALRLTLPPEEDQTGEERQFVMDVQKIYDEAMQRAAQEGETRAVVRMSGLKLGRPLTDAERRVVTERVAQQGPEAVERVVLQLDVPAFERWLAAAPG